MLLILNPEVASVQHQVKRIPIKLHRGFHLEELLLCLEAGFDVWRKQRIELLRLYLEGGEEFQRGRIRILQVSFLVEKQD
ncbi:hypothetical protein D3C73_1385750 [compost metagenome]